VVSDVVAAGWAAWWANVKGVNDERAWMLKMLCSQTPNAQVWGREEHSPETELRSQSEVSADGSAVVLCPRTR
jgi:hypothetical protein